MKSLTFDPFPFPDPPRDQRAAIARTAEQLNRHRQDALARDERVTMTRMYKVVEKIRAGDPLEDLEREVHELAACGVPREFHDTLDELVAEAYGWPWPLEEEEILDRLVRLHAERIDEEARGVIRWLRPEYQVARFGPGQEPDGELDLATGRAADATEPVLLRWPTSTVDQIASPKAAVEAAAGTAKEIRARFDGAPASLVHRHLETLEIVGEVGQDGAGEYQPSFTLGLVPEKDPPS